MAFFYQKETPGTYMPPIEPAPWPLAEGKALYVKWNDDRGRSFNNISNFKDDGECVSFSYDHPESGRTTIRLFKRNIRWLELFDRLPEDE
ncbi:MAG: hypothetical protein IJ907_01915 [Prevotella sp.]|nr:hypothetical protein [Prevotella sp.]MBR2096633.1 hypothetical protein [Prevotella sp.]